DNMLEVVCRDEVHHLLAKLRHLASIRIARSAGIARREPAVRLAPVLRRGFLLRCVDFLRGIHGDAPGADGGRSTQPTAARSWEVDQLPSAECTKLTYSMGRADLQVFVIS